MLQRRRPRRPAYRSIVNAIIIAAVFVAILGFSLFLVGSQRLQGGAPEQTHAKAALLLQPVATSSLREARASAADATAAADAHNTAATSTSPKKRIAYAITITKDGFFQDGAAVLAYSIMEQHRDKKYDVSLVAFVHPNVTSSRAPLERIGYHVIEASTPVNSSAIKFKWFREHIDRNGCCGSSELIKLNSYRLVQYDKVVHMDADTFMLNPIDDALETEHSVVYTTDPNMASHKGDDKMPYQGGFLVFRPNITDYLNIVNLLMTVEFRSGSAWNGSKIGWFWGGMTVQGILPYYYNLNTAPGRSLRVDRCRYNTMADTADCTVTLTPTLTSSYPDLTATFFHHLGAVSG